MKSKEKDPESENIVCPFCGYRMPIRRGKNAVCKDLHVKCKGRECGKEFEIRIETGDQVVP